MIRLIFLVVALLYLVMVASSVSDETLLLQLVPFAPRLEVPMGFAVPIFAGTGAAIVIIFGLADWVSLRAENSKSRREMDTMRGEIESLRNMMIMERETE